VLLTQERPAPEWVPVELEASLVGIAVAPRRSWRRLAILDGALVLPRHAGAGLLDDLPHPLSRESEACADAREVLAGPLAAEHLGVSLLDPWPSRCEDPSALTH
jgi:hypothetical protein